MCSDTRFTCEWCNVYNQRTVFMKNPHKTNITHVPHRCGRGTSPRQANSDHTASLHPQQAQSSSQSRCSRSPRPSTGNWSSFSHMPQSLGLVTTSTTSSSLYTSLHIIYSYIQCHNKQHDVVEEQSVCGLCFMCCEVLVNKMQPAVIRSQIRPVGNKYHQIKQVWYECL